MIVSTLAVLMLGAGPAPSTRVEIVRMRLVERRLLRVPARVTPPRVEWRERRGPKCVATTAVGGAAIVEPASVDLILRGGTRLRAKLERRCPALDYYSGFYVRPTRDGRICAGRDFVSTRSGGRCQIARFRTLLPPRKR